MEFAENHLQKGSEFLKTVLFADENKCNVFGSDRHNDVWRKSREELLDKKKSLSILQHGGGSGMVLGCMAASEVGSLHVIKPANVKDGSSNSRI
jgi:hypothetical protein